MEITVHELWKILGIIVEKYFDKMMSAENTRKKRFL